MWFAFIWCWYKTQKKLKPQQKGEIHTFSSHNQFGDGSQVSLTWCSPALQIWTQASMLQHKDEQLFIDYNLFFFIPSLKFQTLPEILHLTPLRYREMSSLQSGYSGSDKEKLHAGWFFTNFWIMSRYKINLSAADSQLLHFFPGVTANFTQCTKSTLIKAKEPALAVLFGLC